MDVLKKRLALFCAILLLLVALASCGTKTEKPKNTETATTNREEDQTEEIRNDVDDLPDDLDFEQHTIRLFSYVQSETVREMLQEESEVNVVQDAMFKRNLNLEDRLNCRIEVYERVGDTNTNFITDEITNLINGGFDTYNIMTTAGFRMCAMAQLGHFANLLDLPFINTEKDYYSQGYNDALSVGNAQYLLTGQFSLSYYRYMIGMFFNKTLFTDLGVEYPYQTVIDGDWDFHKVAELSANFYKDLNGQGDTDVNDQFGYVMWAGSGSSLTDGYMASAGLRVVGKDGENFYVSDLSSTANFSNAIDKILEMMYGEGSYTSSTYFDVVGKFTAGTAALTSFRLFFLEETGMKNLGETKQGYGILPLPKSDSETQDEYYSYIQDQCLLYAIPRTVGGAKRVESSQFLEAYASESYQTVKSAYYERALTTRYAKDPESVRMLEIMESSTFFDPANIYIGTAFKAFGTTELRGIYASGTNTISSLLKGKRDLIVEEVIKLNQTFQELWKASEEAR